MISASTCTRMYAHVDRPSSLSGVRVNIDYFTTECLIAPGLCALPIYANATMSNTSLSAIIFSQNMPESKFSCLKISIEGEIPLSPLTDTRTPPSTNSCMEFLPYSEVCLSWVSGRGYANHIKMLSTCHYYIT